VTVQHTAEADTRQRVKDPEFSECGGSAKPGPAQSLGSDFVVFDLHTQLGRCQTVDIPRSAVLALQELHHPPRVAH